MIILYSGLAGIVGTGIGGLISALIGKRSPVITCCMLSFAAGVMLSIVCFGMVPEANDLSSVYITIGGIVAGVVIIMLLNKLVDFFTEKNLIRVKVHETPEELHHEKPLLTDSSRMFRAGIIMMTAIALHNVPEGIAIGAGGSHDMRLGIVLAVMIALHNIPEGMSIAAPLISGGMKKWKSVLLTATSGATTVIGGAIGLFVGNLSSLAVALSLSIAGGAMLYVVFGEIIPQSIVMTKSRLTTIIALAGMIVGLLIAQIH